MCFDDQDTYTTRMRVRKGERYSEEYSQPRYGMSWRRRNGLGGSYYPSNYYRRRPSGRYMSGAITHNRYSRYGGQAQRYGYGQRDYGYGLQGYGYGRQGYPQQIGYPRRVVPGGYIGQSSGYGRYYPDNRVAMPHHAAMYIYTPRYGQRGVLTYAGQTPNGAPPAGVIPNGGMGMGMGMGYGGGGMGMGMGVGVGVAAGGYYPGVQAARSYYQPRNSYYSGGANYHNGYSSYHPSYAPAYSGYYNYNMYGSLYPLANFYSPYQRSYYNTVPSYGYAAQAYVYPPGPSATTTTTTYHVQNSHARGAGYRHDYVPTAQAPAREDYQTEARRVATERGAYDLRRIKPADARSDDPFWCRERNGEWHLRTYYQIENECHPGTWKMDAEQGFLVFQRD